MKDIFYESTKDTRNVIFAEEQRQCFCRYHFHRAFEISYIVEGDSRYLIEDEEFVAEKDDIVFINCYYRHMSFKRSLETKYVVAVPENFSNDVATLFSDSTLPMILSDKKFNRELLPHFEKLVNNAGDMSRILSKGYANVIFGSLFSHYNSVAQKPKNKNVSIIAEILGYIDLHYNERITLDSLSSYFGYNKTYFSRFFNNYIGMSVNNYINMVRLDRFEVMHQNLKSKNITDLIFDCGFSSLATFYRAREVRKKNSHMEKST